MEVDIPAFCPDWVKYERGTQAALANYIVQELRRLDSSGGPVLRAVLTHPDDRVQTMALAALDPAFLAEDGAPAVQPRMWFLRLVDGAEPPALDPQGRPLPAELRGKVLRAKVGNIGGNIGGNSGGPADLTRAAGVSGDVRAKTSYARGTLYLTADVTRDPKPFPLTQAVTILRQWGAGVTERAWRSPKRSRGGEPAEHGQALWLVDEVHPEDVKPQRPARRNAPAGD